MKFTGESIKMNVAGPNGEWPTYELMDNLIPTLTYMILSIGIETTSLLMDLAMVLMYWK